VLRFVPCLRSAAAAWERENALALPHGEAHYPAERALDELPHSIENPI
jgi:hypothetical protein